MIICILGRQPAIGLAELESLFGSDAVTPIADNTAALVNSETSPRELGSTIKAARVLETVPSQPFSKLTQHLAKNMPSYLSNVKSDGKVKFGLSVYGMTVKADEVSRAGIFLKKPIKNAGRSVRVVPNTEPFLNSAQVLHNQLTGPVGLELVVIRDKNNIHICQTLHEQNIEAYTFRDRSRPMRDTFVGMLPPKLAQVMINLAYSVVPDDHTPILLDPFCGTGVVLQEAALYGYAIYGTDKSEKMVRYTRDNLVWLSDTHHVHPEKYFEIADATDHIWQKPINLVVGEGYLGRPIAGQALSREQLTKIIHESNTIYRGFFKNVSSQLNSGTPLVIAAPAWFANSELYHLPCLDSLEEYGFERRDFTHVSNDELIYRREGQAVGRELLVLVKK